MTLVIKNTDTGSIERRELADDVDKLTLGRHSGCDVVLAGNSVSRHHAEIARAGACLFLNDTGSSAGTFVGGERLTGPVPFEIGVKALIGPWELSLEESAPAEDDASLGEIPVPSEDEPPMANPAPPPPPPPPTPAKSEKAPAPAPKAAIPKDFAEEFKDATVLYTPEMMELTRRIHADILEKLNLSESALAEKKDKDDEETRANVEKALDLTIREHRHEIPMRIPIPLFRQALLDELLGFGPISPLIRSKRISEIMVNGPSTVFVESQGKLFDSGVKFMDERHLMSIIQRIVEPLGRHVDDASPMVDARLPDGSRVNAIIPPLSLKGSSLTIRKFADKKLTTDDLIGFGSMTREMALFLEEAVKARKNILVSGGTGSGKTTLLNVLSLFIPHGERVITIEDSAELKLTHPNLVTLEARPANVEGKGRVTIRDLVVNTLRMRPDRIIVGECRGAEALDMLQAMNTGHDGSLTTCHANTPRDALSRLENMVMMAGMELPSAAIREQVASAIDIIVQQTRLLDGSRKIVKISEVTGREGAQILMQDIFSFEQTGINKQGKVEGYHTATGNIPTFIDDLRRSGRLSLDMSVFVPKV